jgi:hypothetical protein
MGSGRCDCAISHPFFVDQVHRDSLISARPVVLSCVRTVVGHYFHCAPLPHPFRHYYRHSLPPVYPGYVRVCDLAQPSDGVPNNRIHSCAVACSKVGQQCSTSVVTDNSNAIFAKVGVTCTKTSQGGKWWADDQPSYVSGANDPGNNSGDCLGSVLPRCPPGPLSTHWYM